MAPTIETPSYHDPKVALAAALALHERVCVIDAHCDTLSLVLDDDRQFVAGDPAMQIDLPRLRQAGMGIQVLACWNEPQYAGLVAFARCIE